MAHDLLFTEPLVEYNTIMGCDRVWGLVAGPICYEDSHTLSSKNRTFSR
jgi:hypothetical protein